MTGRGEAAARDLVQLARRDLEAAEDLALSPRSSDAMVGFHCQQAGEKALKGVLARLGVPYPFTHDLEALVDACASAGVARPADLADLELLTPFAVQMRYDIAEDAAALSRATALAVSAATVEWAEGVIAGS